MSCSKKTQVILHLSFIKINYANIDCLNLILFWTAAHQLLGKTADSGKNQRCRGALSWDDQSVIIPETFAGTADVWEYQPAWEAYERSVQRHCIWGSWSTNPNTTNICIVKLKIMMASVVLMYILICDNNVFYLLYYYSSLNAPSPHVQETPRFQVLGDEPGAAQHSNHN